MPYRDEFRATQRDYYWTLPRVTAGVFLTLIPLFGIGWAIQGNEFFLYKFFAPKYEGVRRDVMIESRAYSEATTRRLYDLRRQLVQAKTDDERATIRAMTRHEAAAFDASRLPPDLRGFVSEVLR